MALFGRRNRKDRLEEDLLHDEEVPAEEVRPEPPAGVPGVDRPWVRGTDGPYDIGEWPAAKGRIDLGALRVPAVQGAQMRLDLDQQTHKVVGVTLGLNGSQLQLQAFAAPRSLGIWDELRPEIARSLVDAGGAAETAEGMLGKELRARMPGRAPDGRVAFQPARFLGVDGPRWFLRAVVNGAAATDDAQLRPLLAIVRNVIVVRGDEPRPPREVLELTPPAGVMEAAAKQAETRRAQAEAARRAAAQEASRETAAVREADATGVAGITVGQAPTTAAPQGAPQAAPPRHRAPEPPVEPGAAPKPPTNPEFT